MKQCHVLSENLEKLKLSLEEIRIDFKRRDKVSATLIVNPTKMCSSVISNIQLGMENKDIVDNGNTEEPRITGRQQSEVQTVSSGLQ